MRKKSSSTYSAKKKLEMFGICAQVIPKTVLVLSVSCRHFALLLMLTGICRGLGPSSHLRCCGHCRRLYIFIDEMNRYILILFDIFI